MAMTEAKKATTEDPRREADAPVEKPRTPEEEEAIREALQRKAEAARIIVVHAKD
jgi:hypothetical protein